MRWNVRSNLPSFVALFSLLPTAHPATALAPYTVEDREERQEERLDVERIRLDLSTVYLDPEDEDYSTYTPRIQLLALMCELEAQADGLPHPGGGGTEVDDAEADAHFVAAIAEISDIIGGTVFDPPGNELDGSNLHSVLDAGLFAAYILHRFPEASATDTAGSGWSTATLAAAYTLFKWGKWPYPPALEPEKIHDPLSNNPGSNLAMRLLAADLFDDDEMMQRVRFEYAHARALLARRGLSEPHAPHYGGRVIRQLLLAWHVNDPTLKQWIQDLLEMQLVAAGHAYLPGGGMGAPQQRDKVGGIADPSPIDNGAHAIQQVNMLIYDPLLEAKLPSQGQPKFRDTYSPWTLATDYHVPEIIRSIFLDKGAGYEYRQRTMDSWLSQNGCCGKGYRSTGWQGWNPDDEHGGSPQSDPDGTTHIQMQPGYTAMLPSGEASIGGAYGYQGNTTQSWGAYVANPAAPTPTGFSILYQHQPRDNRKNGTPWVPLVDDPNWRYERKTPYRRMSYARTQVALYDVAYFPEQDEDPDLDYTIAHLPAFLAQCTGSDWWVGQATTGGPYLAYRPLGTWTPQSIQETGDDEDFTLVTLTDPISGYVAEIAEAGDHTDEAAYCTALAARTLSFTGGDAASAEITLQAPDAGGTLHTLELEFDPEARRVDSVQQTDADTFGTGVVESPMATWTDQHPTTGQFTLTVARDDEDAGGQPLYPETRVLEFGDPTIPTPPMKLELVHDEPDDPVFLKWDHGWDDTGIASYPILRNGDVIATVDASDPLVYTDTDLCPQAYSISGIEDIATYAIRSVDLDDNSPTTLDAQSNVIPLDTYLKGTRVQGDVTRPETPTGFVAVAGGPNQALGWWNAASDNWGVYAYWLNRKDVATGATTTFGTNQTWFVHNDLEPGKTYEYTVETIDLCPRWSDPSPVKTLTTPSP